MKHWLIAATPLVAPDADQYAQLEKASELVAEPVQAVMKLGVAHVHMTLARQGVALLVFEP